MFTTADPDKMKPRVLLFGHIPKTAGSTMKTILWRQYGAEQVFFSMDPKYHRRRFDELAARLQAGHPPVQVVVSHAGYGFHQLLPAGYEYPYFTFLRDPIERVLSNYYFFLDQGKIPADTSLERFVYEFLKPGCNMQTSYLSGYFLACHLEGKLPEQDAFTPQLLERAKANLQAHQVIGLTEAFDTSLLLLRRAFGWSWWRMLYVSTNVGRKKPPRASIPPQVMEAVYAQNELDLELYAFGKKCFEAQCAQLDLEAERRRFQTANRVFAKAAPVFLPVLRTLRPPTRDT